MAARATARLPCRAAVHAFTFVSIHIEANARDDAPLDAAAFNPLAAEMDSTGPGGKRTG
ncbi:TPA: hypothetical protein QDC59_003425 [Burkholderia cenocepacia]|uniref:hypothetical protein n=1 Tax=Burkholderia orbicola TaxID=2978683 RepID=UPI00264A6302|nr:hypothetical protein [Burkholderia orbicola]MDN7529050.1 hypothetical protein [Burkholderia orbicola]HDR9799824.1 hypothetical protein [Burkholderia cenocepacia]